ncbi:hypothetical protein VT84_07580 [Gemmata sp. SH-PL17]|nr:hypothetical protein [Gemmata sp. SH-PL17]AMV24241.1 hypothetical protein VT84_07580 [Gemmata sp. SH-PL17]
MKTERLKTHLRASWRFVLVSLLRLTRRVETGLAARVHRRPVR